VSIENVQPNSVRVGEFASICGKAASKNLSKSCVAYYELLRSTYCSLRSLYRRDARGSRILS
jgi:hypothetical protein